jgi:cadmium resistance protein CadD (predicted permease)
MLRYIYFKSQNMLLSFFQIMPFVSKLFLNYFYVTFSSGYKSLKVFIHIFHSLDWFQILWYIHNVFTIKFYKILFIYLVVYNPKFKKLSNDYDCFWYILVWLHLIAFPTIRHICS